MHRRFRCIGYVTREAHRGSTLTLGVAAVFAAGCLDRLGATTTPPPPTSPALAAENHRLGDGAWDAGLYGGSDTTVTGYVLPSSVQEGDTLSVFVSATTESVSVG